MINRLSTRRQRFVLSAGLLAVVVVCGSRGPNSIAAGPRSLAESRLSGAADNESRPLQATDLVAAQQVTHSLGIADWLGPLAPMALSPFFAVTCLSGMSLYGGDWLGADNPFLGENSPLHNGAVFVVFLILTVLTSVPRFTKVSKPFAQAIDQLEAWAGIITMLVLRILVVDEMAEPVEQQLVQAGIISGTVDTLLMIAAIVNVFVINSVKFFFEILVWLIPFPSIDAIFEAANKTVCGALMLIYGYSPMLATGINLCLFVVAAIVLRRVYRTEFYYRSILLDTFRQVLFPSRELPKRGLTVFPDRDLGGIPARSRCLLVRTDDGWQLVQPRLLKPDIVLRMADADWKICLQPSLVANNLHAVEPAGEVNLTITRRYQHLLRELCDAYHVIRSEADTEPSPWPFVSRWSIRS